MPRLNANEYDAVIIGAGISGLVCGCYLAKAGMKVFIAEQHFKPGGYCTSFKRGRYTFDAAAHCFGAYRKDGIMRKIFNELEIDKTVQIIKNDPSDVIITPDYEVSFFSDIGKTERAFQKSFPEENNNIRDFFNFVLTPDPNSFSKIRSWTFKTLLDKYFNDDKLKAILSGPLLGNGGLPPSSMSAFIGAKLFSEFILDGGYYPVGGMQKIPDALAEKFKAFGGKIKFSALIKKIKIKNKRAIGVLLSNGEFISSRYVISACDATQTFLKLIGKSGFDKAFHTTLKDMKPSISNFVLYLGFDKYFSVLPEPNTSLWFFSHYDLDKAYAAIKRGEIAGFGGYMLRVSHDKLSAVAIIPAPFKSEHYWKKNKQLFMNSFVTYIEETSIPNLSKHVVYKDAATPYTMFRYTLNHRGASYGWAGTPDQLAVPQFKKPSFCEGLYLTGHWSTQGLGISGVSYLGYDTAKLILRKEKIGS